MAATLRVTDRTSCTCSICNGAVDTFINGLKRVRISDVTIGHSDWINNAVQTGSSDLFNGSLAGSKVGDFHTGHPKKDGSAFHRTSYITGSPDHQTD